MGGVCSIAPRNLSRTASISSALKSGTGRDSSTAPSASPLSVETPKRTVRSEEHTSELQSRGQLVCRLLLVKKIITAADAMAIVSQVASNIQINLILTNQLIHL